MRSGPRAVEGGASGLPPAAGRWGLVALAALAFAFAYPMQVNGWNQNAHYALVRALAQGTPIIDETRREIGDLGTGDVALFEGHYYSNKAPGLAFATMPAFVAVEAIGMRTTGDPTRVIWALHLWSIVVPGTLLLVLVGRAADRVERGLGTAAAVTLGAATLVLPFSTLFFSHVLSACLGFAAFAVLFGERARRPSLARVGAAGALAGLAVVTEYPLVLVGAALALYALVRPPRLRRALAYAAGAVVGAMPLLAYNTWAFGSPTHHSYEGNQTGPNDPLRGFFGAGLPDPGVMFDLLFSAWGVLTLTPVIACGAAGAVLLYRRGMRSDALVLLGVPVAFLVWGASLGLGVSPFGGLGPPRYLVPALPFLAVPLAVAYRAFPLTTGTLALISAFQMAAITGTNPLAAYDGDWIGRVAARSFSQTAASLVDVTGWYTIVPFFAALAVAAAGAVLASRWPARVDRRDVVGSLAALGAWALVAAAASNPSGREPTAPYIVSLVVVAAALAAGAAVAAGGLRTRMPGGA